MANTNQLQTNDLTDTQLDILTQLALGETIKRIAYLHGTKRRTISKQICEAREILGVKTRDQAIAVFVTQYGIPGKESK